MLSDGVAWMAVMVAGIAATGIFVARDWRWQLGLIAAQYLGGAILTAAHWPLGMAAAFLVTGWMSVAAVGMTLSGLPKGVLASEESLPRGSAFRLLMVGMVLVLAAGLAPRTDAFLPGVGAPIMACTIMLIGIGILHLGMSTRAEAIILGLFMVLTGFEVFYSAVEASILVAGLLSAVTLGLGLVGAYLLIAQIREDGQ